MRFAWRCARADLRKTIVSTPLRDDAFTLNPSISSTGMRRSKRPYWRSLNSRSLSSASVVSSLLKNDAGSPEE